MADPKQVEQIKVVLTKYMKAWKQRKYQEMQACTTHTYRSRYPSKGPLEVRFPYKITKYKVLNIVEANPVMYDAWIAAEYRGETVVLQMRLIKELKPFVPTLAGTWGINPISIRQLEEMPKSQTNA